MKDTLQVQSFQRRQIMALTDRAIEQVKILLQKREKPPIGIRIGVKSGGCSGLKYFVEYADEKRKYDEVVKEQDLIVFIDPKALMYLIGTKMDYIIGQFKSGFTFSNPNEKGKCGCGSSFNA